MLSADIHDARSVEDDEIGDYIRDYWKRNDPTPDTEYNENREMFIQRVSGCGQTVQPEGIHSGLENGSGQDFDQIWRTGIRARGIVPERCAISIYNLVLLLHGQTLYLL